MHKKTGTDKPCRHEWFCSLALDVEGAHLRINSSITQLVLDAEQLVVLGNTLGTGRSTGLDLAGIQSHSQVSNGGILGLTRAVRGNGGVASLVSHLDGFQGLGNGTDLVQFDQDAVAGAQLDALAQTLGVGHEQVVADQLYLAAQLLGHLLPAVPVFFIQTIFDGDDRILLDELFPVTL